MNRSRMAVVLMAVRPAAVNVRHAENRLAGRRCRPASVILLDMYFAPDRGETAEGLAPRRDVVNAAAETNP